MNQRITEQALFVALYLAMVLLADKDKGSRAVAGALREYSRACGRIGTWFHVQSIRSHNTYRELIRP